VWGRARATFGIKALQQKPSKNHRPPTQGGPLLDARIHYPVHKHPAATQTPHTRHQHPAPTAPRPEPPRTRTGRPGEKNTKSKTGLAGQRPHRQRQQPPRQPAGAASYEDETDPTPAQRAWGRGPVPSGPNSVPTPHTPAPAPATGGGTRQAGRHEVTARRAGEQIRGLPVTFPPMSEPPPRIRRGSGTPPRRRRRPAPPPGNGGTAKRARTGRGK
jgi:hypothetical protein